MGGAPQAAPSADELVQRLDATPDLKNRDKPFEISVSLARLYLGQGRYREALSFYQQALVKAAPVKALYEQLRGTAPKTGVPECEPKPTKDMASLHQAALDKQKAKDLPGAAACIRSAAQGLLDAQVQVGHAQFLAGDGAAALKAYEEALATEPANAEAHYARGALLLDTKGDDVPSLKLASADFAKFLADAAQSPKAREAKLFAERVNAAIAAGGVSKLPPPATVVRPSAAAGTQGTGPMMAKAPPMMGSGGPPPLSQETMEAFQNTPRTPEMQAGFAKAIDEAEDALSKGQFQAALDDYKQVMPYQPENPRVRAGMAWSLFRLGKPMADRVWGVASQSPEAIDALGQALEKKGNADEAKAVWKRLAETVPNYAIKGAK